MIAVALVVVLVVVLAAGLALRRSASDSRSFPAPVTTVDVEVPAGAVHVRAGEGGGATVIRELRWLLRKPRLTATVEAGVLRLRASGSPLLSGVASHTLDVPPGAALRIRSRAAEIDVRGPFADAELSSSAGAIVVEGARGRLVLHNASGAVSGSALHAASVEVHARSGSVRLAFADPPSSVEVTTTSGPVEVAVPGGPYRVDAASSGGEAAVEVAADPAAPARITVRSGGGSVRVSPA